jgi:hypothetical protein
MAQSEAPEAAVQEDFFIAGAPMNAPGPDGLQNKFLFISAEMEHGGKVVKGAPYSAEALTERTQTLADGNRIVHKSSATVYRDAEGRTRREMQMTSIGNWEATENPPRMIMIHDPVSQMHYVLHPEEKTVRKMNLDKNEFQWSSNDKKTFEYRFKHAPPRGHQGMQMFQYEMKDENAKTESLGKQMLEGVLAEGTRTTVTIAAGEMGNEFPIQIVSERWYSPDLQVNVMTRHNDPRFGETVYQLTNINRVAPDPSLFEVPKDYKVDDSPIKHKIIKREKN